jgi:hypothetical protein
MEIEFRTNNTYFSNEIDPIIVDKWKTVWRQLCDMAYYRKNIVEKLIVLPKSAHDATIYKKAGFKNEKDICFDTVWKEYSHVGSIQVVPELKELYVPFDLLICPGIWAFMDTCFPNCKIQVWD